MRTEDLIAALAADHQPQVPTSRRLVVALAVGALLSFSILLATLGIRADFAAALPTWRFDAKLIVALLALALAVPDTIRLARPQAKAFASRASVAIPILLGLAVLTELYLLPAGAWASNIIGTNAKVCLVAIPLLSLPPLVLGLIAMREGAPASPAMAGASVGRLAAGVAASLYALHCFDDSPLFVAVWYQLATLIVIGIGALAGSRILRW